MHCATQSYCNKIVGSTQEQGFAVGERAGSDGQCRYHNDDCPHNGVPKRALEFAHVAANIPHILKIYNQTYEELTSKGSWEKDAGEISINK
jgi:hypothetical protein